jgi:23S rRNA pseudouridine1911/1915/1917 synthase
LEIEFLLNILYEDKNIIAVDKPAGILIYYPPHFKQTEQTLMDQVFDRLDFKVKGERNGIVHRLDRETSGVILFAKNEKAETELKKLFKEHKIKKYYIALVSGKVEPIEGRISIPLGRAPKDRLKVVPKASGKPSETLYRVLKYFPATNTSLLQIELKTGRMHQIRVHFAAIGHPVVGDSKYGNRRADLSRQFLHAKRLEFMNPFDDKKVVIESKLPPDLELFLATH